MSGIMKKFDAITASSYNDHDIWSISDVEEPEQLMCDAIPGTETGDDIFSAFSNIEVNMIFDISSPLAHQAKDI